MERLANWVNGPHSGLGPLLWAAALACLYFAVRYWRLAASVADTARARVRSAPHGYVELFGHAEQAPGAAPTIAPLSGRQCVWWRYRVEQRRGRRWHTVSHGQCDAAFLLHDETGVCRIDPRGASVIPSVREIWYGPEPWPRPGMHSGSFASLASAYRYVEEMIHEYDGVCALGEFAAAGGIADGNLDFEVAALLHDWKAASAALLKRFDRDGDGQLSDLEWAEARSTARSEVLTRRAAAPIVKQMAKPTDARPYLLAARDPHRLAQIYRRQVAASLAGFFVAVVLMLRMHPPG